jgi:hypothetical protein
MYSLRHLRFAQKIESKLFISHFSLPALSVGAEFFLLFILDDEAKNYVSLANEKFS